MQTSSHLTSLIRSLAPFHSRQSSRRVKIFLLVALSLSLVFGTGRLGHRLLMTVFADNTAQTLPLSQNWANTGLITANDSWSGVPGIEGFLGDDASTTATGIDPQTILTASATLDVIANQTNPNTLANGGVAEFDTLANPSIALNGSGTADAPYILIHLNTTGLQNINVAYNLRDLDGSVDNAISPVALQFRVGNSGNFTNVPAGFVADASTGPSLATLVTPVSVLLPAAANNVPLLQVRVITSNAVGNDEWIGVDDISITSISGLSVSDATVTEGNVGTVTASFIVSLSSPAPAGGVSFDITTADNSATAPSDYVTKTLTGQGIPEGSSNYTFDVTVNGDLTPETDEKFFVNVSTVVGATPADTQGEGTITNDDITRIHDIQGAGLTSPLSGVVTTRGIVTGIRSNGFYIQEGEVDYDANPNTSEGIFVFTSSAPPAAAVVGNIVTVTGTITEFIPSADPLSPPVTEITSPTTVLFSTGNPLPAPIVLTTAQTPTNGTIEQLERFEGMRVNVPSLTVVAPTQGNTTESSATALSNGVFYGVITGVNRPFREAGIEANDPVPAGSGVTIPPVPRFDANPERLRVDSDGQVGGTLLDVTTFATVTNLTGPLDYSFRTYTILPDPAPVPAVSGNIVFTPVPLPTTNEFTVASFNMNRFFDTVNDPGTGDAVLSTDAFNNRLNKASLAIRNVMLSPDIIGVVEVENLTTLQAVATKLNTDSAPATPNYQAFLVEGNDPGGIDVGFLVKSARVGVVDVTQFGLATTYINPNNMLLEILNDRPPLVLRATVTSSAGVVFPVTVIVNHLRSLIDVDDPADGNRVRTKRRAQAEFLANLIQARLTSDPTERIISIGDFNAFQFNDGLVDSIGTIRGVPTAANMVVLASSDLVNPDLTNLLDSAPADQRYSFTFDGNAQSLDHTLITSNLLPRFSKLIYARSNADFPEVFRNDPNRPERLSDHDMPVAYFTFPPCQLTPPANIVVDNDPGDCGADVTYPAPTATDCGVVTCLPASGSFFAAGLTTVTCTAATGTQATFTVTVTDTQPPVISCPNNIVRTIPGASDVVTFNPTATDNCNVATVVCTPPSGSSFNLGTTPVTCIATDTSKRTATCGFNVTLTNSFVANPQIQLADPLACAGPGNVVGVTATIANPTAINQTGTFTAALGSQLLALPGSCTTNIGSCTVVNPSTVNWSGTIPPGQTATITYQAQVADNSPPGTQLCVVSTATFNGQPVSVTACNTVNCPLAGPGLIPDARSMVSDQKAGSVLFFNIHTSAPSTPAAQNTRINITNSHPTLSSMVHLFFADGATCSVADSYLCLTPNETTTFLASDIDPGTTGYVVAIAVDRLGCPANFNYLIGDEFVKFATGHSANLGAEAFSALAGGLPACNLNSALAVLAFDNISYNAVSRVLALDNIPSRADGNDTLFILNRFGGNLAIGAATLGSIFGIAYDDAEAGSSFTFLGLCQFRSSLSNNFPRTVPRLETLIPAGGSGWMKLFSPSDIGMLGAAINFNPNASVAALAFSQGHNLHKMKFTTAMTLTVPVFPPRC